MKSRKLFLFVSIFFVFFLLSSFSYALQPLNTVDSALPGFTLPNPTVSSLDTISINNTYNPHTTVSSQDTISTSTTYNPHTDTSTSSTLQENKSSTNKVDLNAKTLCSNDVCLPPGITDPKAYFSKVKPRVNPRLKTQNANQEYITSTVANTWGTMPLSGSFHIPVLLVDFSGTPHSISKNIINDIYNSPNYLNGRGVSANKYFLKESYGDLNITFDIYDWKTLPNTYAYYAQTNNTEWHMELDTIAAFDSEIDFTKYDSDHDGRVDGIAIVHAGEQCNQGTTCIGTHANIVNGTYYKVDGILLGDISEIPEKVNPTECRAIMDPPQYHPSDCRISTYYPVHEFSHVLGVPDLYAIDHEGHQVGAGLGRITMMMQDTTDDSPDKPINYDAWSRFFLGWLPAKKVDSSGTYNIRSIDSYKDLYYLRDPNVMNSREFFLVENRYKDPSTEDEGLFNISYHETNDHGGLAIYHIDENYIADNYDGTYFNTVEYDADGKMYDDTISHPGIVYEMRYLQITSNTNFYPENLGSLYTTEVGTSCNPIIFSPIFDSVKRIDPNCGGVTDDTTSHSYNGLQDTQVVVKAESVGGPVVKAFLQSVAKFSSSITSPVDGTTYYVNDNINFTETNDANSGPVSCSWYSDKGSSSEKLLSTDCNFTSKVIDLGLSLGTHKITLLTEDGAGKKSGEILNITIASNFTPSITSPSNNSTFSSEETINFNETHTNNTGSVSCVWYSDFGSNSQKQLSTSCNFSSTATALGLSEGNHRIKLTETDSITSKDSTVNITIANPIFNSSITSPVAGSQYYTSDTINFSEDHNNNVGTVSCNWYLNYNKSSQSLLSNQCSFSKSGHDLYYSNDNNNATFNVTLVETDSQNSESNSSVTFKIESSVGTHDFSINIVSPTPNTNYAMNENVSFIQSNQNGPSTPSCIWYLNYNTPNYKIINRNCNFQATPASLGLSLGYNNITLLEFNEDNSYLTSDVRINITSAVRKLNSILSPLPGFVYNPRSPIYFMSSPSVHDCSWYSDYGGVNQKLLSTSCSFNTTAIKENWSNYCELPSRFLKPDLTTPYDLMYNPDNLDNYPFHYRNLYFHDRFNFITKKITLVSKDSSGNDLIDSVDIKLQSCSYNPYSEYYYPR